MFLNDYVPANRYTVTLSMDMNMLMTSNLFCIPNREGSVYEDFERNRSEFEEVKGLHK